MFFQSAGCCEGGAPKCFEETEFSIGQGDVLLGTVGDCPFYMWGMQFQTFKHTQLFLDVAPGPPEDFSIPAGDNEHFVVGLVFFSDEERAWLEGVP